MATGKETAKALYQGKALNQQKAEARRKAIAKAVENVFDKTCSSCADAAKGQGVTAEAVRVAVREKRAALAAKGEQ